MALNNFIGKRKWKSHFETGREALEAGDYKTAEHSLQLALEQAVNISEKDSAYGDTALLLGQVYRRTDRRREADDMAKNAFGYYEKVFGVTDPRTIQAHLAIVLANPEKSHADPDVRKATYELARVQFGERSWQVVRTAALALSSFSSQQREKTLSDAQAACTSMLNENRVNLATWPPVAEEFSFALFEQGYSELAAKFMGIQLRLNEERFGEKSQEAALARLNLGEMFLSNGHAAKAEIAFSRAIDLIKLKVGPRSPEVQRATISLARALAQQKKLDKAAPHLTEALTLLGSNQVDERLEVLVALLEQKCLVAGTDSERGALWQELESLWDRTNDHRVKEKIFLGLLAAQNRLQQGWELISADRFLHAVLARVRKWRGPHHPNVAHVMMELASCSISSDDKAKAKSFMEQSLALDESVDNLIRGVNLAGKMGDLKQALVLAERVKKLLKNSSPGLQAGQRAARMAEALLLAGDLTGSLQFAQVAMEQLPESERLELHCNMARAQVMQGNYSEALENFKQGAPKMTDPYGRALAFLQLAWVFTRTREFTEAKAALEETTTLLEMRPDHPLAFQVKAVSSQIAFYSGSVYEGKELRQEVLSFLKSGHHGQSARSLGHLVLMEPFGPDESQEELEIGTQILAATEFPDATLAVFPTKDAACVGLRHVARALHFSEQGDLAKERLSQYKERFAREYEKGSPQAFSVHLTQALLSEYDEDKANALESALECMKELTSTHVGLFPVLSKLTELHIKLGNLDLARSHCRAAISFRQSPRLVEWMETLDSGALPEVEGGASSRRSRPTVEPEPPAPSMETPPPSMETPPSIEGPPSVEESSSQESSLEESEPSAEESPSLEITEPPITEPEIYQDPPATEDEDFHADRPTIQEEVPTSRQEMPAAIAATGASNLADLQLARFLSERAEAPTPEETEEFLKEVAARFGQEVQPNLEARVLLALLFPDGAEEATQLWADALTLIAPENSVDLLTVENRARDASSWSLVVQTLEERLRRENIRHGENAVETLETQMRLAKAQEAKGQLRKAYRRLTMVAEILRSWFGARSRRLLSPLAELIRVAESLNDVQAAFEHQLERHRLLEAADGDAEELFNSRITLLPIRGRLGQIDELLEEAHVCEQELVGFRSNAASEFVRILLTAAKRVDQLHWRSDAAATLLEIALRVLPDNDVSLGCRVRLALAECQYRKDYRSQASRIREEALDRANSLDADTRAEMFHLAAQSCLRIQEIPIARSLAERILEERIAQAGRKDIWAGRALLVLAEADLRTFRLEGTETAIGMSAPSLQGTRFWSKAQALKLQALFFLNRFDEAFEILDSMKGERALDLSLQLAVWRGNTTELMAELQGEGDSILRHRWENFELLPLDAAVNMLEFFARAGQAALMAEGMTRIWGRIQDVLQTDIRHARLKVASACLQFWEGDWDGTASTLQRTIEMVPEGSIEFPEGLTANLIREALLTCFLEDGRSTSALAQAQQGVAEAGELLGEEDIRSISFKVRLAQCAQALGQLEDALALLDEILVPLQDVVGDTHVLLRDIYRGLATTFLALDDIESARMSAEEALRIDKECRGLSIHFLQDLELLAEIEVLEDAAEAIHVMETAVELSGQLLPKNHPYEFRLKQRLDTLVSREPEAPVPQAESVSPEESSEEDKAESGSLFDSEESVEESVEDSTEESEEQSKVDSAEALFGDVKEESTPEKATTTVDSPESLFGEPLDATDSDEEDDDEFELSEEERAELSGEWSDESNQESKEDSEEYLEGWAEVDEEEEQPSEEAEADDEESDDEAEEVAELEKVDDEDEESDEEAELEEDNYEEAAEVAEVDEVEAEVQDDEESDEEAEEVAELEEDEAEDEESDEAEEVAELEEVEAEDEESDEEAEDVAELEEVEHDDEESDEEAEEVAELEQVEAEDEESDEAEEVAELEEVEAEDEESDEEAEEVADLEEVEDDDEESDDEAEEVAELEEVEAEDEESEEEAEEVAELEEVEVDDEEPDEAEEVAELEEVEAEDEESDEAEEVAELEEVEAKDEESDEEAEEVAELEEVEAEDEESDEEAEEVAELEEVEADDEESDEAEEVAELEEVEAEDEESDEEAEEVAELEEVEDDDEESEEEAEEVAELEEVEADDEEVEEEAEEVAELEDVETEDEEPDHDVEDEAGAELAAAVPPNKIEESAEQIPRPYKLSSASDKPSPVSASASVEMDSDFPEVPLRIPHISEPEPEPVEEVAEEGFDETESVPESAEDLGSIEEVHISVEALLSVSDPESYLLPLAPVFFLPVPWKEATEASFADEYEELYRKFQRTFKKGIGWRPVAEEAVSVVRSNPCHASAYFLFLLGAQMEKGGHLHTADVCLATSLELLDSGPSLGAACHLAGRVAGRRGELRRALEYFERSAELAGEAELAVLKIDAAECHLGLGRPEEALLGFEEVFDFLAANAPKVQALAVQAKMAQIHLLIGDPDSSQALAEETRAKLSPKNAGTYRVLGRMLLSRAFARLGRHELALELAEKAWEGAEPWSAKRKDGRRIAISNLVDIYCVVGKFDAARELILESGLTGWGLSEAELLLRAGHVACAQGNLTQARQYVRLGRAFLERFQSPALWRSCFLELEAEIRLQSGEYAKAAEFSKSALELFESEATGPVDKSRHIVRSAKIAGARGELAKARDLIEQARSLRDLHLGSDHPHTSSVEGLTAVLSQED